MALIPEKTKSSSLSLETMNIKTLYSIAVVMVISNIMLSELVHPRLVIFALPFAVGIFLFLLFPNSKNKDKNGAERIIIMLRFYLKKNEVIQCLKK